MGLTDCFCSVGELGWSALLVFAFFLVSSFDFSRISARFRRVYSILSVQSTGLLSLCVMDVLFFWSG